MAKFDYKKWIIENKHGSLNEQEELFTTYFGCSVCPENNPSSGEQRCTPLIPFEININDIIDNEGFSDPFVLINNEEYTPGFESLNYNHDYMFQTETTAQTPMIGCTEGEGGIIDDESEWNIPEINCVDFNMYNNWILAFYGGYGPGIDNNNGTFCQSFCLNNFPNEPLLPYCEQCCNCTGGEDTYGYPQVADYDSCDGGYDIRYSCAPGSNVDGCIQDINGPYDSLEQCQSDDNSCEDPDSQGMNYTGCSGFNSIPQDFQDLICTSCEDPTYVNNHCECCTQTANAPGPLIPQYKQGKKTVPNTFNPPLPMNNTKMKKLNEQIEDDLLFPNNLNPLSNPYNVIWEGGNNSNPIYINVINSDANASVGTITPSFVDNSGEFNWNINCDLYNPDTNYKLFIAQMNNTALPYNPSNIIQYPGSDTYYEYSNTFNLNEVCSSTGSEATGSEATGSEATGSEATGSNYTCNVCTGCVEDPNGPFTTLEECEASGCLDESLEDYAISLGISSGIPGVDGTTMSAEDQFCIKCQAGSYDDPKCSCCNTDYEYEDNVVTYDPDGEGLPLVPSKDKFPFKSKPKKTPNKEIPTKVSLKERFQFLAGIKKKK